MNPFLVGIAGARPTGLKYVGGFSGQGSGSITIQGNLAGGLSSSAAAGDIVIVSVVGQTAAAIASETGAWTTIANLSETTGGSLNCFFDVAYRVLPDLTEVTPNLTGSKYAIQVWRGVDQSTPLDVATQTTTHPSTALPNPPAITPVTNGAVVLALGGGAGSYSGVNYITGLANEVRRPFGTFSGSQSALAMGSYEWTSGAYDPAAFSLTSGSDSTGYNACSATLALRPAS